MLPGFRQFFKELYGLGVNIDLAMCKANAIADFVNNVKKNPGFNQHIAHRLRWPLLR